MLATAITYPNRGGDDESTTIRIGIERGFGSLEEVKIALDVDGPALHELSADAPTAATQGLFTLSQSSSSIASRSPKLVILVQPW